MNSRRTARRQGERTVPGTGGPGPEETSSEGRSALRLHAGIAAIGAVLSGFVTWIFILLGTVPLAWVFGVIAAMSLVILGWALYRQRRALRALATGHGAQPSRR